MKKTIAILVSTFIGSQSVWGMNISPYTSKAKQLKNDHETKKVLVVYDTKNVKPNVDKAIDAAQGDVTYTFKGMNAYTVELPADEIASLEENPHVTSIEEDVPVHLTDDSIDWGVQKVNAPTSWQQSFTGKGVKVAIVDTGIDTDHPDLKVTAGTSTIDGQTSYEDDNGHGTHVAGTIAAKDNGIGMVGVAPDADLYIVKALAANGSGSSIDVAEGIDWAVAKGANVINLSLSSGQSLSPATQLAVDHAYNKGVLVVGAAGNESTAVGYPAKLPSVIAVSAVDSLNHLASFSNYGPEIEVTAPGVSILSTYLNGTYAWMSGTSMAAPHVTGVLALLKQAHPTMSVSQIRSLLQTSSVDLGAPGRDSLYGFGLVQSPVLSNENPTSLSVPASLKIADRSPTSLSLSWDGVANATSYDIYRNNTLVHTDSATTFTDNGLTPNTPYAYSVVATNGEVKSGSSTVTGVTKLSQPTLSSSSVTSSSATLTIGAVPGATGYELYRNNVKVYSGSSLSFTDTKLVSSTTYTYQAKAVNLATSSDLSGSVTVKTSGIDRSAPGVITSLATPSVTSSSIQFTWKNPHDADYSHTLIYRNGIYTGTSKTGTFTQYWVAPNASYRFDFINVDTSGNKSSAVVKYVKTPPVILKGSSWLTFGKTLYTRGERTSMTVTTIDSGGKTLSGSTVTAVVTFVNNRGYVERATVSGKTAWNGKVTLSYPIAKTSRPGVYTVTISSSKYGYVVTSTTGKFTVK